MCVCVCVRVRTRMCVYVCIEDEKKSKEFELPVSLLKGTALIRFFFGRLCLYSCDLRMFANFRDRNVCFSAPHFNCCAPESPNDSSVKANPLSSPFYLPLLLRLVTLFEDKRDLLLYF